MTVKKVQSFWQGSSKIHCLPVGKQSINGHNLPNDGDDRLLTEVLAVPPE
jgi:hypothetical protein